MNARERMLAVIRHERPDRIPTDIWATHEVWAQLRAHFGAEADIAAHLHIDGMAYAAPRYVGPPLPAVAPDESVDYWGIRNRRIDYGAGAYMEQCVFPLASARSIEDLERYPWPQADWFDFSAMPAALKAARETHVTHCGYMAIFFYHTLLRGLETALMDPHDDAAFTRHLLQRVSDVFYDYHLRLFETCAGLIDIAQVTDDYGSQTGLLISAETFRDFYQPHMQRFIDLCHGFGIKVFHHDDGAIRPLIPEFVAMGIDILNPVQANCPGMEMAGLKRDFGQQLCFHGGIDNQEILPYGTPEQVRAAVRQAIDTLASDGTGYILAPCHNLQAVSPVENILAMYDEAWHYGKL